MKKKVLCTLLTLFVSIGLTACGTKEAEEQNIEPILAEENTEPIVEEENIVPTAEEMVSETENTEAEIKEDISYESWQEAYEDFLLSYQPEHAGPASKEEPHFNLAYVDEDDIPELIIIDGLAHSHGGNVYTWYEGKVVYIGMYGQYGGFGYLDKENLIHDSYDGADVYHDGFYKIEGGEEVLLAFFTTRRTLADPEAFTEEMVTTYYVDKEEVTKAEYDKQRDLYPEYGEFTSITYHDSYPIDESTLRSVFDMER
ncbi:MAG: hypothetical protein J1E61_01695 [Lachnospiraceae bacterium]|nr:hypothetical protein [Lachnospiraceae bacterium]